MNSEYLLINILILSGPIILSFDRKVNFVQYWPQLFPAILSVLVPFIIWDALVTDRHWWFNTEYTLPFRFLGLPAGEWLFFITVPYACIFSWEVLWAYFKNKPIKQLLPVQYIGSVLFILTGFLLLTTDKEYTTLVMFSTGFTLLLDKILNTNIFIQRHTIIFGIVLTALMLVFNGYLTARPVVLYNSIYQLDFRIFTIPIEDFFYGYSLIFLALILYEKLKRRRHG